MTDNEIIKALECCSERAVKCKVCPAFLTAGGANCKKVLSSALDIINRQRAEIEELNECYTNLSNASWQHDIDHENDRQLLGEYQNLFLDLGYAVDIYDPELKEIKAWKDRMIWHCKRADELLSKNNELKAEIERLQKRIIFWREDIDYRPNEIRAEAIKEFAERLHSVIAEYVLDYDGVVLATRVRNDIDNLVKEMTEEENA